MLEPHQERKSGSRGCLIAILILFIILVIGSITVYVIFWHYPGNPEKAREIRKSYEEKMDKANMIPRDENAWFLYNEAAEKYDDSAFRKVKTGGVATNIYYEKTGKKDYKMIEKLRMNFFLDREERITEDMMMKAMKAEPDKYQQSVQELERLNKEIPYLSVFPKLLFSNQVRSFKQYVYSRVNYGGILTASAIKWYQKKTGKYPDNLSDLVPDYLPELPRDHYSKDGKFIYRTKDNKAWLYSIGDDLKDDQGKIVSTAVDKKGDIMFLYPVNKK